MCADACKMLHVLLTSCLALVKLYAMKSDELLNATTCIDSVNDFLSFYNIRLPDRIVILYDGSLRMVWEDAKGHGEFMCARFTSSQCRIHFPGYWQYTFNWHEAYDKFSNEEMSF